MTNREAQVLGELVDAAQALHVTDGQLGRPEVWSERWRRHEVAAAAAAELLRERRSKSHPAAAAPTTP